MIVTFDIETLPTQDELIKAEIAKTISPPGNISKAETIAKWEQEKKQEAIDEAIAKTSFDGAYGQICCIGWAIDDDNVCSVIGDEKHIIGTFFTDIEEHYNPSKDMFPRFVGHNVHAFDLRFLFQRAVILGIEPPRCIPFNAKPWSEYIFDTSSYFAGQGNRISLDKLSKVLGLEGKTGVTGADVWPMYQAGKIEEIATYCEHDVMLTREVYKRLTFKKAA